jgi:hypothetical protein
MIAYASDNYTNYTTTTYHGNGDDAGSGTTSNSIYKNNGIYLVYEAYVETSSVFNDNDFEYIMFGKETARRECVYRNRIFFEHFYKVQLALIFNVYSTLFNRRMMFSKSGFLARTARKRKN